MRIALKKSRHLEIYPHERLTLTGEFNRGWARAAAHSAFSHPDRDHFSYPALDQELLRDATCVFTSRIQRLEESLFSAGLYGVTHSRWRTVKHTASSFVPFSCDWRIENAVPVGSTFAIATTFRTYLERALLERAAKAGNQASFLAVLKQVDWNNKSAADYSRFVNLALEAGAHMAARQIAARGAAKYQQDAELQKQAKVLAPPRVIGRTKTSTSSKPRLAQS